MGIAKKQIYIYIYEKEKRNIQINCNLGKMQPV